MKLIKFKVRNFRSITSAEVRDIGNVLVLIGPNNEGKSNILRAVRLALAAMEDIQYFTLRGGRVRVNQAKLRTEDSYVDYSWSRDFPVQLQSNPNSRETATRIRLTFQLDDQEIDEFQREFKLKINGVLPIELTFSKRDLEVDIIKQGPKKAEFKRHQAKIAKFLSERLVFVYIPPIRTSEVASRIINKTIRNRIRINQREILGQIAERLRQSELETFSALQKEIKENLIEFIPDIREVKIESARVGPTLYDASEYDVKIDDGRMTPIEYKGDGVQSLVSLALMRSEAIEGGKNVGAIFAIEEPEAHLNSEAVYKLRKAIISSGSTNQVMLTTHSSIFAHIGKLSSNVVVRDSKAMPAKNIAQIRDALGVRVPENLSSAAAVVLVEGDCDKAVIDEALRVNTVLRDHLDSGFLRVESIDGAPNLLHSCRHYSQLSCEVFAFLDRDNETEEATRKAIESGYLKREHLRYAVHSNRSSAEIEDLFIDDAYHEILAKHNMPADQIFSAHGGHWSIRAQDLARRNGVHWDKQFKIQLKLQINTSLSGRYVQCFTRQAQLVLDQFIQTIVAYFDD